MQQSPPTHQIFDSIRTFVVDYLTLLQTIHDNASQAKNNLMTIKLLDGIFLLPATFQTFSQRAQVLQHRLQRQIRTWAQTRRNHISKGVDEDDRSSVVAHQQRFDQAWQVQLEQLQKASSDSDTGQMLRYLQSIIGSLEFYDEMTEQTTHRRNQTFRRLPILQNIEKQVDIDTEAHSCSSIGWLIRLAMLHFATYSATAGLELFHYWSTLENITEAISYLSSRDAEQTIELYLTGHSTTGTGDTVSCRRFISGSVFSNAHVESWCSGSDCSSRGQQWRLTVLEQTRDRYWSLDTKPLKMD